MGILRKMVIINHLRSEILLLCTVWKQQTGFSIS